MTGIWLVSYVALWLFFLVVAIVLVSVMRNMGVVYEALKAVSPRVRPPASSLTPGQLLPEITVQSLDGDRKLLSDVVAGARYSIDVVSPSCQPCIRYLEQIDNDERPPDPLDPEVRLRAVISVGSREATHHLLRGVSVPGSVQILVDDDQQVGTRWGITTTPSTVIVDEERRVVRQTFSVDSSHNGDAGERGVVGHEHVRPMPGR
jgi:hypothetical protein